MSYEKRAFPEGGAYKCTICNKSPKLLIRYRNDIEYISYCDTWVSRPDNKPLHFCMKHTKQAFKQAYGDVDLLSFKFNKKEESIPLLS